MRLNRNRIRRQLAEAREQLQDLERRLAGGEPLSEGELEVYLGHAYHHLNFAWNCRKMREAEYRSMTDVGFYKCGRVPLRVAENVIPKPRGRRGA